MRNIITTVCTFKRFTFFAYTIRKRRLFQLASCKGALSLAFFCTRYAFDFTTSTVLVLFFFACLQAFFHDTLMNVEEIMQLAVCTCKCECDGEEKRGGTNWSIGGNLTRWHLMNSFNFFFSLESLLQSPNMAINRKKSQIQDLDFYCLSNGDYFFSFVIWYSIITSHMQIKIILWEWFKREFCVCLADIEKKNKMVNSPQVDIDI